MQNKQKITLDEVDAKGGRRVKGMPYVLGISLFAIISLSLIIYAVFSA